jgi:hypothetical protein
MIRPSHKELFGKLRDARDALKRESVFLLDADLIAEDAMELGYDIGDELLAVLGELLEDTSPRDYAGSRPPQRSYKPVIEGLELLAFVIESRRFACRVYLKFAIAQGSLWLVSLHADRPREVKA